MLDGPIDLLFFSLFISQRTSPAFVGFIKEYLFGLLRHLEMNLDFIRLSSIFSAIFQVKWLLKLIAILKGLFIVLLPTWMQLISLLPLIVRLIIFLMPSQTLKRFSLFSWKKFLKSLALLE